MTEDQVDTGTPSIARAYDVVLGGTDNYPIDRQIVGEMLKVVPQLPEVATYNRRMLARGVRYLTEQGIDQFIDLGSGLPTVENTHQVAQRHAPGAHVVYVDIDPLAAIQARKLLAGTRDTAFVTGDLRDPASILAHPDVTRLIDFSRPVGLMLVGVLHHLNDDEDPEGVARAYRDALVPGSHLFATSFCRSFEAAAALEETFLAVLGTGRFRTLEEIGRYFDGLEMVDPGLVYLPEWRPDQPIGDDLTVAQRLMAGGIGRKR